MGEGDHLSPYNSALAALDLRDGRVVKRPAGLRHQIGKLPLGQTFRLAN
jgi:hypothetical protein